MGWQCLLLMRVSTSFFASSSASFFVWRATTMTATRGRAAGVLLLLLSLLPKAPARENCDTLTMMNGWLRLAHTCR